MHESLEWNFCAASSQDREKKKLIEVNVAWNIEDSNLVHPFTINFASNLISIAAVTFVQ